MTEATKTKKASTRKPAAKKTTTKRKPVSLELPPNPLVFEIFDLASRQRTKAKKVEVLTKFEHPVLKSLFIWNYDERIVSALPEGEVPYGDPEDQLKYEGSLSKAIESASRDMYNNGNFSLGNTDAAARTTLRSQYKNLYHFVEGGNSGLSKMRRESMFINLLQSIHPLEAEILCLVKDKKLGEVYKIPQDVVSLAYPDIQWWQRWYYSV